MEQSVIHQDEREHGFGDRSRANADTRIMAAFGFDDHRTTLLIDRPPRNADTGRRFDGNRHDNILAR